MHLNTKSVPSAVRCDLLACDRPREERFAGTAIEKPVTRTAPGLKSAPPAANFGPSNGGWRQVRCAPAATETLTKFVHKVRLHTNARSASHRSFCPLEMSDWQLKMRTALRQLEPGRSQPPRNPASFPQRHYGRLRPSASTAAGCMRSRPKAAPTQCGSEDEAIWQVIRR